MKRFIKLDPDMLTALGKASTMGMHMVSGVLVGGLLGWALDRWLGTGPWLLLIFAVLGIAAGFRNVWVDMHAMLRAQDRSDARSHHPENRDDAIVEERDATGEDPEQSK